MSAAARLHANEGDFQRDLENWRRHETQTLQHRLKPVIEAEVEKWRENRYNELLAKAAQEAESLASIHAAQSRSRAKTRGGPPQSPTPRRDNSTLGKRNLTEASDDDSEMDTTDETHRRAQPSPPPTPSDPLLANIASIFDQRLAPIIQRISTLENKSSHSSPSAPGPPPQGTANSPAPLTNLSNNLPPNLPPPSAPQTPFIPVSRSKKKGSTLAPVGGWSRILLTGIPTSDNAGKIHSEADLETTLRLNPVLERIQFVMPPRWLLRPDDISKKYAALTFSVHDPNGSLTKEILQSPIGAFGARPSPVASNPAHPSANVPAATDSATRQATQAVNSNETHASTAAKPDTMPSTSPAPTAPDSASLDATLLTPTPLPPMYNVRIMSVNMCRSNVLTHALLASEPPADIILIQEPWQGSLTPLELHLPRHQRPRQHPAKVMAYSFANRLDLVSHPSLLILEVIMGEDRFFITNVYHDVKDPSCRLSLFNLELDPLTPALYIGDFNTHSPTWSPPGILRSSWAHDLEDWAALNLLDLLNTPGVPTRFGEGGPDRRQRDSTINLAWANAAAAQADLFHDFLVDRDIALGSDHAALLVTFFVPDDVQTTGPPPLLGFKIDLEQHEEWLHHFPTRALPQLLTPENIDTEADTLYVDIGVASEMAFDKRRPFSPPQSPGGTRNAARSLQTSAPPTTRTVATSADLSRKPPLKQNATGPTRSSPMQKETLSGSS
ncbi:hypothetical protein BJV77DRAFT_964987 [Russula vinacea]|nr:hypothetical protein BJV77DRAFT_964987 [Russula vinacea]